VAEIDGAADVPGLATTLPELSAARRRLGVIARSQVPLMIAGETGTGKDVDLRVLSATHRPLEQMIEAGEFRADLHGRLSGHRIALLPLRARREDLGLLVAALLRRLAGDRAATFTLQPRAAGALLSDRWPGNIRELERVLAAAVVLASDGVITMDHLPKALGTAPPPPAPAAPAEVSAPAFLPLLDEVEALERTRMSEALAASGGNQTRAAALIGMPLRTFQIKHEQYGLGGKGR
jgi:DNA-binding NtrC family response regulator